MTTGQLNSLGSASSSYLRSAMHQPIQWQHWGEQAFKLAAEQNKPVLLDIGAVWCHWCHVMDRESYESAEIAEIINQHFIAVKVDRDERPEVDARYQTAVAAISGQGGWPLTVFLTPEGKPFYGGTYFPPEDRFGRPGFRKILLAIAEAFRERRADVEREAGNLMHALSHAEGLLGRSAEFSPKILEQMVQSGLSLYDRENGGFGTAPKFPHPAALDLLIDWYARTGEERVGSMVTNTLEKMASGGMYDQIAGGFHRYSVDERWCVPHFEKMSYDNSELLKNYVHGWQATGNPFFAHVAMDIMRWMDTWLSDREQGSFYASQDADISLDDDGDHFTWSREEAQAVLTPEEFEVAAMHWDIGERGEMHHNAAKNVLWVSMPVEEIASRTGRERDEVKALIESARVKMEKAREHRTIPYIDKTLYTNWNALCITAYLQAARALGTQPEWASRMRESQAFALKSLERLWDSAWNEDGGLSHVIGYSHEQAPKDSLPGLLDDYAYTVLALIEGYETTSDSSYFERARHVVKQMLVRFYDTTGDGFFDVQPGVAAIGAVSANRKPFQDAPTPAGNSAAAIALLKLHALTNNNEYYERAKETIEVFAGAAEQFGIYAGTYGIASVWLAKGHTQIVVVGDDANANELYAAAARPFSLNKIVLRVTPEQFRSLPPALAETVPNLPNVRETASAVVCSNFTCQPPVGDPEELKQVMHAVMR